MTDGEQKFGVIFECTLSESALPRAFEVVIIRAGESQNEYNGRPLYYSPALLAKAAALFEGAVVNAHRFGEELDHIREPGIDKSGYALNTIGHLESVKFTDGALRARLVVHEGADFIAGLLKASVTRSSPIVGLSIDAMGLIEITAHEGREVAAVVELRGPATVDVVSRPAAGGEILRIAASLQQEAQMPEDTKPPEVAKQPAAAAPVPAPIMEAKPVDINALKQDIAKELREEFSRENAITAKLAGSGLDAEAQTFIRESITPAMKLEDVDARIDKARKILASKDTSGRPNVPTVQVGTEQADRIEAALDYEFQRNGYAAMRESVTKRLKETGAKPMRGFRAFIRENYGRDPVDQMAAGVSLHESLTTGSWASVFKNALNKAVIAYSEDPQFADWRRIVTVESIGSYETQTRLRSYGYGNLPVVTEAANYTALTSPGDDEETYAATKKGGTEDITEEMILADKLGAIAAIPRKLGLAAARTIYEAVFDYITVAGQPTLADGNTLFYARTSPNGNLGTTAISNAQFIATRLLMQKFTDTSTSKRLGIEPKFLCIPADLYDTAFEMFKPFEMDNSTTSRAFAVTHKPEIIVVRHWSNAKDHTYIADPSIITGLIVGFVQGNEQPQLFVQDQPNVGSRFDADKVTYKIKYPFGVGIGAYQAFYEQDVA